MDISWIYGASIKFSPDGQCVACICSRARATDPKSYATLWHALDGSVMKVTRWQDKAIHGYHWQFTPGGHLLIPCEDQLVLLNTRRPFGVITARKLELELEDNMTYTWSPDRALFALCTWGNRDSHAVMRVAVYRSNTLEMLSKSSLELEGHVPKFSFAPTYVCLAFSHDGRRLLCIQELATPAESICYIWDTPGPYPTASPPRKLRTGYIITHATFNPVDSSQLFIVSKDKKKEEFMEVRDVVSGAVLSRPSPPTSSFYPGPKYSSDGRYAVFGKGLYAIGTGVVIEDLFGEIPRNYDHISFSPDGTRLVVIGSTRSKSEVTPGVLWKRFKRATHWQRFAFVVQCCQRNGDLERDNPSSFSPDSRFLAIGRSDGTIALWDTEDVTCLAIFTEHTTELFGLAFSPDGGILCSVARDGAVHFHNLRGFLPT